MTLFSASSALIKRSKKGWRYPVTLFLSTNILLAGCTMAPKYHRPAASVAPQWPKSAALPAADNTSMKPHPMAADLGWQDFFKDARLKALITIAIRENRDLRSAIQAIGEAQARYRVQRASLLPAIGGTGEVMYQQPSGKSGLSFAPGVGEDIPRFHYYSMGIGFSSYEIDIFGRIRSLSKEAAERALMQEETARGTLITLISQVANSYIAWLADRETLNLAEESYQAAKRNLDLTQALLDHGEASLLTVNQAETLFQQKADLREQAKRQMAWEENNLVLLIGQPLPDNLPPPLPFGEQNIIEDLSPGLPSDLLENRPDIRAAEHDLKAANADIGAARAAFFPRLSLTSSVGNSSLKPSQIFTTAANTWGFQPELTVPIFNWGQNRANLRISKAERDMKITAYQKAIQSAFHDVSNALVGRDTYRRGEVALTQAAAKAENNWNLARLRQTQGSDSAITMLNYEQIYYQAEYQAIQNRVARYQNLVTLYSALGGGVKEKAVSLDKTDKAAHSAH
ncbi:efflux transporter outer membrane subunit [Zymomonas mobilis]|uniref:efflux transporter outer membrane subunit n=1 Tax=Zymomonas mobilis TaxID=542 RepID=UPI0021C30FDE|nr:efflux transporter outer membrane subunit [Zymomonas mobilis]MCP9306999.1 efflux transporter outer membrane subunit [Zymomonas mobilis]